MLWGYLSEFWNAVQGVGDYTIEFFQSIGNAVAGAVGSLFDGLIHSVTDVFVFFGWFFSNLAVIFERLFLPVRFVFQFLKSFVTTAFSSPVEISAWTFSAEIKNIFHAIPLWDTLILVLGVGVTLLAGYGIFKKILSI